MRLSHFETLKPICPRCKTERQIESHLQLVSVEQQTDDSVIEGNLLCSDKQCQTEYPIIDGVPIIIATIRKYINDNFYHITHRNDLSLLSESLLGDYSGPGSEFNTIRHYLSSYGWDHYGDQAPENEFGPQQKDTVPGSVTRCLQSGFNLFEKKPATPALDIGCALGRSTFEVAQHCNGLTLGIDLNFSLLRVAQMVLREGRVSFPLKRCGIVYDRHEYQVTMPSAQNVDFWACDGAALPFRNETFNFVSALNVLDTVNSPANLLHSISSSLKDDGQLLLSTPYDWAPPVPIHNWFGGHAQRAQHQGSSEAVLRSHLAEDSRTAPNLPLAMVAEIEHHPWSVRVHDRRTAQYDAHILACKKCL